MKLIHECYSTIYSPHLYVYADFEKFILKIELNYFGDDISQKIELDEGIEGIHQCTSLEEVFETYNEIAEKLFADPYIYGFRDMDNDDIEPIDLKKWYNIHWKPVDTSQLNEEEIEAMNILKKVLVKWNEHATINNLVFYWDDDSSRVVYVNNKGVNRKSDALLKKHIKNPKKSWLNGTLLDVTSALAENLVEKIDAELPEIQEQVNNYMYKICAILEANKCFNLIKTAKDFKAFNVWHEEEENVNFQLRNKYKKKYKKK